MKNQRQVNRNGASAGLTLQTLRDAHLEAARSIDDILGLSRG
jgi:hypothetical protein